MVYKLNHVLFSRKTITSPTTKKILLAAAVALTAIFILVANWDVLTKSPIERFQAAYENRRFDEAIAIAEEILAEDPESAEAYRAIAAAYLQKVLLRQSFDESLLQAEAAARAAIGLDSENVEARRLLGYALELSGKIRDAEQQYRNGLEIEPNNPMLLAHLASIFRRLNQLDQAREYFLRAVLLSGEDAEVRVAAARFFLEIGDPDGAIEVVGSAVEDSRPVVAAEANRILSASLIMIGEIADARRPAERAVELAPESYSANQNYGELLLVELFGPVPVLFDETLAEATSYASRAIELNPESAEANFLAFKTAHIRGDRQAAESYAAKTLSLLNEDTSLSGQRKTSIRMFIRDVRNIEPRLINAS